MTSSQQTANWMNRVLPIILVIGGGIWLLRSCDQQQQSRDLEMKGRGMLEARGVSGDLPPSAGADYYRMREDPAFKSEDYQRFFRQIKMYQAARRALSDRGLSRSKIDKISEWDLYDAMESSDREAALDRLATRHD